MAHVQAATGEGKYVRANGLDVYYREIGQGESLLLLHGGSVSTSDVWADHPWGWGRHLDRFAAHFRVIAPDTRGHGRTVHPGGEMHYRLLAEDVIALIDALDLHRPLVFGFSDGGITASLIAMHHPGALRAIVNHAGYDLINRDAPIRRAIRTVHGGSPMATAANPALIRRWFATSANLRDMLRRMQADHDAAQGEDHWLTLFVQTFPMRTIPLDEDFEDFRRVTDPTLILIGDRDEYCSVEEAVLVYRLLARGELAILPNVAHALTDAVTQTALDFLLRHASRPSETRTA
jgi:pimeloyl-ACP methyl ester carboxylesterase